MVFSFLHVLCMCCFVSVGLPKYDHHQHAWVIVENWKTGNWKIGNWKTVMVLSCLDVLCMCCALSVGLPKYDHHHPWFIGGNWKTGKWNTGNWKAVVGFRFLDALCMDLFPLWACRSASTITMICLGTLNKWKSGKNETGKLEAGQLWRCLVFMMFCVYVSPRVVFEHWKLENSKLETEKLEATRNYKLDLGLNGLRARRSQKTFA